MKLFWNKVLAGFVIGAGAIIPGLSGGILAVSMGLYQPTIEAVTGFFKKPKENFKFLLPIAIGGVIGFLIFLMLIDSLFADFQTEIICLFLGLVIGSIPSFLKEAKGDAATFKKRNWIFAVMGFAAVMALILLGIKTGNGTGVASREITPLISMLCGGIIIIGTVLPGVSTSFVLINMGVYENFMKVFTNLIKFKDLGHNIVLALFALLGVLIVAVPMLLLVRKVLERFHRQSYFALFGILISTIVGCVIQEIMRYSAPLPFYRYLIFVALFVVGLFCSYIMDKSMKKLEVNAAEQTAPAQE